MENTGVKRGVKKAFYPFGCKKVVDIGKRLAYISTVAQTRRPNMAWLLTIFIATAWTYLYCAYGDRAWVETEAATIPTATA